MKKFLILSIIVIVVIQAFLILVFEIKKGYKKKALKSIWVPMLAQFITSSYMSIEFVKAAEIPDSAVPVITPILALLWIFYGLISYWLYGQFTEYMKHVTFMDR